MGYYSTLRGEIKISPPLRWSQIKNSRHCGLVRAQNNHLVVYLRVDSEVVETDDGPLTRRTAETIQYCWAEPEKLGAVVEEIQALVDAFPAHQFIGEFLGQGEDYGDIWRLRVNESRKVERILPKITWPDGTETINERY